MVAYDFRVARKGDRVEMAIDRVTRGGSSNGKGMNRSETTRSGTVRQVQGQVDVIDRSKAKPDMVAYFDQMEAPLVVLTLDAEGGEVGRAMKGVVFDTDMVDILRTFSPRFPRDKAEWDVKPNLLPMPDQKSEGTLHYVKRPAAKGSGLIEVDVSGKLAITGKYGPAEIKKAHRDVKGVQTFDPRLGEWVAGKWTIQSEIEAVTPQGETRTELTTTVMTLAGQDRPEGEEKGTKAP